MTVLMGVVRNGVVGPLEKKVPAWVQNGLREPFYCDELAAMELSEVDVQRFWKDGYLHLKQVFSHAEIEAARAGIEEILRTEGGRTAGNIVVGTLDLLSYPLLRQWIYDDRVIAVVRRLLDAEPVYFGDSSFQTGQGDRGWHRDNRVADRLDHSGLDWEGRYPIIRMGIYLQDHAKHSGGLGIRVGSHLPSWIAKPPVPASLRRSIARNVGRPILVDTTPGDLVLWTLRTTHTGNSVRLKGIPWLKLPTQIEDRLPSWLSVKDERKRAAMFASYGARSEHLNRYLDYLKTRDYIREMWKSARVTDEVRQTAREKGLDVMRMEA